MDEKLAKCRETGSIYKILSLDGCKLKNPETREWQDAVIYQDYINYNSTKDRNIPFFEPSSDPKIWVMEKNDFTNKFEII